MQQQQQQQQQPLLYQQQQQQSMMYQQQQQQPMMYQQQPMVNQQQQQPMMYQQQQPMMYQQQQQQPMMYQQQQQPMPASGYPVTGAAKQGGYGGAGTTTATTISQLMPTAPPIEACGRDWSNAQCDRPIEDSSKAQLDGYSQDSMQGTGATGSKFFSAQEMQALRQGSPPVDVYKANFSRGGGADGPSGVLSTASVGTGVPTAAATAVAQPVLVTSVGMPITPANAISTAETHFDGYKG
eukprot:g2184.t1